MNATILALLQLTASFLLGIQHNPKATLAAQEQAVVIGSQAIQLSVQATANLNFAVPPDDSIWPNIQDVENAPYLYDGTWVPFGQEITVVASSTSFGDLNGDGIDDAVVLVDSPTASDASNFSLAALVNQGGILFNVADAPLGSRVQIYSHSIQDGVFTIDAQVGSQPRSIRHYVLLGDRFKEED